MGAGRTCSFTLGPTRSPEGRTRSCATSSPSGASACLGSRRANRRVSRGTSMTSTSRHTHPVNPPHAQRARGAAAANDPFPGVEKVRDGLWSIPVPLPNNSLALRARLRLRDRPRPVPHGCRVEHRRRVRRPLCRHGRGRHAMWPTSKASWSPISTPITTGWPAASARRRARGSRSIPLTPS